MSVAGRVLRNVLVVFSSKAVNKLLNFIVLIYLARYLGTEGFGKYSFVIAYLFFFNVLAFLGINKIVVREISKDRAEEERIIGNALGIRLLLSVISIILSILIINLLGYPSDTKILVYIISLTLLFSAIRATYASIFEARLRMEYSELGNFLEVVISATLILSIIFLGGNLVHVMIVLVFASLCNLLVVFYFSKKLVKPKLELNFSYVKRILVPSIPTGLAIIFRTIYYRIDVLMLSLMKTNVAIGYYSAAYTLISALEIIPRAIMMSVFPLMSRFSKSSKDSLEMSYEKSFRIMLMISLPIAVMVSVFSKEIILLLYKDEFLPSTLALSTLIWSAVFLFLNILFANLVISVGKEWVTVQISLIMALVNIILNYLLIPDYSYIGASIATVLTEALCAVIFFSYIYINLIRRFFAITILKLVLLNTLLYFILKIFNFLPTPILIVLSFLLYIHILLKTNCITKEELLYLKSFIS
ncbi:hypothetical protein DRP04_09225 [Archaeoglobales archaeon]|nr:MAG: hypothetical protein DRP04_09225 [Archaeoglobales archaeon]